MLQCILAFVALTPPGKCLLSYQRTGVAFSFYKDPFTLQITVPTLQIGVPWKCSDNSQLKSAFFLLLGVDLKSKMVAQ